MTASALPAPDESPDERLRAAPPGDLGGDALAAAVLPWPPTWVQREGAPVRHGRPRVEAVAVADVLAGPAA